MLQTSLSVYQSIPQNLGRKFQAIRYASVINSPEVISKMATYSVLVPAPATQLNIEADSFEVSEQDHSDIFVLKQGNELVFAISVASGAAIYLKSAVKDK